MAAAAKKTQPEPIIVTPVFRGSYVWLDKPQQNTREPNKEPEYSITAVLLKTDKETVPFLKSLQAAMEACMQRAWGKVLTPAQCKDYPIRDGDKKGIAKENEYSKNAFFFKMKNKTKPGIRDANMRPIIDPDAIYSGAWYRASFNVYAWNNSFGTGVSLSLNNVMKVKDDEKITSRSKPEDDFKQFIQATPAAPGIDLGGADGDPLAGLGGPTAEEDPLAGLK